VDAADEKQPACALVSLAAESGRRSRARPFVVTELALILGIQGVALAYVFLVGRGILLGDASTQRLRRLEGALHRATAGFLSQELRIVALGCVGAGTLVFVLHALGGAHTARIDGLRAAFIGAASVFLGGGLALMSAYVTLRLNLRASVQVATTAAAGLDRALRLAVRAGGVGGLVCEAASLSGFLLAFGAIFALAGGTAAAPADALALARDVVSLLTGFPLGAGLAAVVLSRAGGTYHTASTLGADLAGARDAGVGPDDPKNPALVSGVAGDHLAEGVSRAALLFSMASAAHVAVLALGLSAIEKSGTSSLALPLLPFVARAFFLLATTFALSAVRTEELANPSAAVVRGHVSATVIGLCGVLGSCFWLQREHFGHLFAAGVVASATAVLVALPVWAQLLRRNAALREAGDALRGTGLSAALSSFTGGLESALLPTFALGAGAVAVWQLGQATGMPYGGLWASLLGWAALFGAAPFAFAVSSVAALANAARGTAALAALDADAQRRTERLDETHVAAASARAQLIAAGVGSALLAALAMPILGRAEGPLNLTLLEPAVTWSGALGVALVLSYAGSCTRAGIRGAREVAAEVERQLRGFPREQGLIKFPRDFAPTYKLCVDLSARSALRSIWLYTFGALGVQVLVAGGLVLFFRGNAEPVALRGVTSFVLFAALTGFTGACAIDTARATLAFVRRLARTQLSSDPKPLSATAGIAGLLGSSAGPALQALVVATASVGLSLAPFLKS
jgi:Na+/H+-translocating membrane pyrophosphatase